MEDEGCKNVLITYRIHIALFFSCVFVILVACRLDGGSTVEALSKGDERNYACDVSIDLPDDFLGASKRLIERVGEILAKLEEHGRVVSNFTIGKTLVRAVRRRRFSKRDPTTWRRKVPL